MMFAVFTDTFFRRELSKSKPNEDIQKMLKKSRSRRIKRLQGTEKKLYGQPFEVFCQAVLFNKEDESGKTRLQLLCRFYLKNYHFVTGRIMHYFNFLNMF